MDRIAMYTLNAQSKILDTWETPPSRSKSFQECPEHMHIPKPVRDQNYKPNHLVIDTNFRELHEYIKLYDGYWSELQMERIRYFVSKVRTHIIDTFSGERTNEQDRMKIQIPMLDLSVDEILEKIQSYIQEQWDAPAFPEATNMYETSAVQGLSDFSIGDPLLDGTLDGTHVDMSMRMDMDYSFDEFEHRSPVRSPGPDLEDLFPFRAGDKVKFSDIRTETVPTKTSAEMELSGIVTHIFPHEGELEVQWEGEANTRRHRIIEIDRI